MRRPILGSLDFTMLLIRLILGFIFLSSGLCKLSHGQFGQLIGPPNLIEELSKYGLGLLGYFISTSQVVVGALCLSQRFSLIGITALVPINCGILMVTTSQGWAGTPFINALLLLLNLLALGYEWPYLKGMLGFDCPALPPSIRLFQDWKLPTLCLGLALLALFTADRFPAISRVVGSTMLIAAWVNLFAQVQMSRGEKGVLLLFLVGILSVVNAPLFRPVGIHPLMVFVFCTLLGFFLFLWVLWEKRHRPSRDSNHS